MSSFVDHARIHIRAGKGGDGAVAFHREKYVAAGGPDGGDGGRGGSVIFVPDDNLTTLMDFRYKRKFVAEDGANGQGKRCAGKDGEDLLVRVPAGTLIRDTESGPLMHDMSDGKPYLAAKGGRGGWGVDRFSERWEIHPVVRGQQCTSENCELSFYDAVSESGCSLCGGRQQFCYGGYPGHH